MNFAKWFLDYIQFFTKKLRLSNPWRYKVPLLISFTYFFLAKGQLETNQATIGFFLSLLTVIGFAGIGYLTNDWADRSKDRVAGKYNPTSTWSNYRFIAFLVLFASAALLPWYILPLDGNSIALIILELLLFVLYAFPPFRLKERGVLGVLSDALYAHVVPGVLASYTFYLFTGKSFENFELFIIALITWQFFSGIRNILYHQLIDVDNDVRSKTITFVTQIGVSKANRIIRYLLLPLEFVFFGLFLIVITQQFYLTYIIIPLGLVYSGTLFLLKKRDMNVVQFKRISNAFLDRIYILFVPLVPLISMIWSKTEVKFILLVHLLIFPNVFIEVLKNLYVSWKNSRLFSFLFRYQSYLKGTIIHMFILILYGGIFSIIYFIGKDQIKDEAQFFYSQLILSRILVLVIFMHFAVVVWFRKKETMQTLSFFFQEVSSPHNLALFRILFFLIVIGSFIGEVFSHFTQWTTLDDTHRVGLPFIQWLTDILPISPEIYRVMSIVGLALAIQIFVGFKTRIALIFYVPIALYLWGIPNFFGKLNHRHIMVWVPMILMFSKCSDVFSIDAYLKRTRHNIKELNPSVEYALPLKFIWITLAIIYCSSGLHKLWDAGLHWILSDNLRNQIVFEWVENYDKIPTLRIDKHPLLLRYGAATVVLMEIMFPLLILKSYLRPFACISAWTLHLSAGYFLFIDFVQLRMVNLSFLDGNRFLNWLKSKFYKVESKKVMPVDTNFTFKKFRKMALSYVVIPLVSMNIIFSVFQISSWPFSTYPSYSSVVGDDITVLRLEAKTASGESVKVKELGKAANFRWENIRPFEQHIIRMKKDSDTSGMHSQIDQYWELWKTKVNGLDKVVTVDVYYETTSIFPEKRGIILDEGFLVTLNYRHEN